MRHRNKTVKLGRKSEHRDAMLANQVCSLILHRRIRTTLAKAKATRPLAEKLVTLGKRGDLHARRTAISYLRHKDVVKVLFETIAPAAAERKGGYTRIIKLGPRASDSSPMAFLEWVDFAVLDDEQETTDAPEKVAKAPKKGKTDTVVEGETKEKKEKPATKAEKPAKAKKPAAKAEKED